MKNSKERLSAIDWQKITGEMNERGFAISELHEGERHTPGIIFHDALT